MKIVLVEDEKEEASAFKKQLYRYQTETGNEIDIKHYTSGESFLENYKGGFDVVFMDIKMPGMSGLECAERLRKADDSISLIFMTNLPKFALECYKYDATDYFIKPVSYYLLKTRLNQIKSRIEKSHPERVLIHLKAGIKIVIPSDVYYIESRAHVMDFHAKTGDFWIRDVTMKDLEKLFEKHDFKRCNVCFLVNLRYCTDLSDCSVTVAGTTLAVSRNRYKDFVNAIADYFKNGGI